MRLLALVRSEGWVLRVDHRA